MRGQLRIRLRGAVDIRTEIPKPARVRRPVLLMPMKAHDLARPDRRAQSPSMKGDEPARPKRRALGARMKCVYPKGRKR